MGKAPPSCGRAGSAQTYPLPLPLPPGRVPPPHLQQEGEPAVAVGHVLASVARALGLHRAARRAGESREAHVAELRGGKPQLPIQPRPPLSKDRHAPPSAPKQPAPPPPRPDPQTLPPPQCGQPTSTSSDMTRPSVVRLLLMWQASRKCSPWALLPPWAPPLMRSLPAGVGGWGGVGWGGVGGGGGKHQRWWASCIPPCALGSVLHSSKPQS